jgi:hypothetical protein
MHPEGRDPRKQLNQCEETRGRRPLLLASCIFVSSLNLGNCTNRVVSATQRLKNGSGEEVVLLDSWLV